MYDVIIIGCGVVGAAAAWRLGGYELKTLVVEKQNDVAMGATRANSAIIHAGFDPEPGTLMARLNVEGSRMAGELCRELSVPYIRNGALVLAFDEADANTVRALYERGVKNGVEGLRVISADEVRQMEPHVSDKVVCALHAPTSAIIDPWEYAIAFAETAAQNGVEFSFNSEVTSIKKTEVGYSVETADGKVYEARYIINAAGVHSDRVHNMVAAPSFKITPCRGDYCVLDKCENEKAACTLFQCPGKEGKGVLVTPTVHGNLLAGPNAVNCVDGDRVNTTAEGIAFVKRMAAKSVPDVNFRNTIRQYAGMRANNDQTDFIIGFAAERFLDLAGIKSPGLSAAPAIAVEAVKLLEGAGLELVPKPNPVTKRVKKRFNHMTVDEKRAAIAENPLYGRVICRCETVTEAEIVAAIHSPLRPRTVDGIKRRAGAGMGRCQGGFCSPRVVEILARELGVSPLDILKDGEGSRILVSETKAGDDA
ncbi:MAG: FAD-dependent oxidoreductase [Clostridia bacterium]|nr:FAD-dependent oxidoreductase [Clostridia bacterium]